MSSHGMATRSNTSSGYSRQQIININIQPLDDEECVGEQCSKRLKTIQDTASAPQKRKRLAVDLEEAILRFNQSKEGVQNIPSNLVTIPPTLVRAETPAEISALIRWLDTSAGQLNQLKAANQLVGMKTSASLPPLSKPAATSTLPTKPVGAVGVPTAGVSTAGVSTAGVGAAGVAGATKSTAQMTKAELFQGGVTGSFKKPFGRKRAGDFGSAFPRADAAPTSLLAALLKPTIVPPSAQQVAATGLMNMATPIGQAMAVKGLVALGLPKVAAETLVQSLGLVYTTLTGSDLQREALKWLGLQSKETWGFKQGVMSDLMWSRVIAATTKATEIGSNATFDTDNVRLVGQAMVGAAIRADDSASALDPESRQAAVLAALMAGLQSSANSKFLPQVVKAMQDAASVGFNSVAGAELNTQIIGLAKVVLENASRNLYELVIAKGADLTNPTLAAETVRKKFEDRAPQAFAEAVKDEKSNILAHKKMFEILRPEIRSSLITEGFASDLADNIVNEVIMLADQGVDVIFGGLLNKEVDVGVDFATGQNLTAGLSRGNMRENLWEAVVFGANYAEAELAKTGGPEYAKNRQQNQTVNISTFLTAGKAAQQQNSGATQRAIDAFVLRAVNDAAVNAGVGNTFVHPMLYLMRDKLTALDSGKPSADATAQKTAADKLAELTAEFQRLKAIVPIDRPALSTLRTRSIELLDATREPRDVVVYPRAVELIDQINDLLSMPDAPATLPPGTLPPVPAVPDAPATLPPGTSPPVPAVPEQGDVRSNAWEAGNYAAIQMSTNLKQQLDLKEHPWAATSQMAKNLVLNAIKNTTPGSSQKDTSNRMADSIRAALESGLPSLGLTSWAVKDDVRVAVSAFKTQLTIMDAKNPDAAVKIKCSFIINGYFGDDCENKNIPPPPVEPLTTTLGPTFVEDWTNYQNQLRIWYDANQERLDKAMIERYFRTQKDTTAHIESVAGPPSENVSPGAHPALTSEIQFPPQPGVDETDISALYKYQLTSREDQLDEYVKKLDALQNLSALARHAREQMRKRMMDKSTVVINAALVKLNNESKGGEKLSNDEFDVAMTRVLMDSSNGLAPPALAYEMTRGDDYLRLTRSSVVTLDATSVDGAEDHFTLVLDGRNLPGKFRSNGDLFDKKEITGQLSPEDLEEIRNLKNQPSEYWDANPSELDRIMSKLKTAAERVDASDETKDLYRQFQRAAGLRKLNTLTAEFQRLKAIVPIDRPALTNLKAETTNLLDAAREPRDVVVYPRAVELIDQINDLLSMPDAPAPEPAPAPEYTGPSRDTLGVPAEAVAEPNPNQNLINQLYVTGNAYTAEVAKVLKTQLDYRDDNNMITKVNGNLPLAYALVGMGVNDPSKFSTAEFLTTDMTSFQGGADQAYAAKVDGAYVTHAEFPNQPAYFNRLGEHYTGIDMDGGYTPVINYPYNPDSTTKYAMGGMTILAPENTGVSSGGGFAGVKGKSEMVEHVIEAALPRP
jgi:hypothetical protein